METCLATDGAEVDAMCVRACVRARVCKSIISSHLLHCVNMPQPTTIIITYFKVPVLYKQKRKRNKKKMREIILNRSINLNGPLNDQMHEYVFIIRVNVKNTKSKRCMVHRMSLIKP